MGAITYGLVRTVAYAPPLKKDEYVTERVVRTLVLTTISPWVLPRCVYTDLKNLEHRVRKMPGSIDRYPW
jgi:hypothetical protein